MENVWVSEIEIILNLSTFILVIAFFSEKIVKELEFPSKYWGTIFSTASDIEDYDFKEKLNVISIKNLNMANVVKP